MLVLGIIYMLVMRFMLKGEDSGQPGDGWKRRTFRDLIKEYRLTGRARRGDSPGFSYDRPASGRPEIA